MNDYDRIAKEIRAEHSFGLDRAAEAKQKEDDLNNRRAAFAKHFWSIAEPSLQSHLAQHPLKGNVRPNLIPNSINSIPPDEELWLIIAATTNFQVGYGPWNVSPRQYRADVTKYHFNLTSTENAFQLQGPSFIVKDIPKFGTLAEALGEAQILQNKFQSTFVDNFNLMPGR